MLASPQAADFPPPAFSELLACLCTASLKKSSLFFSYSQDEGKCSVSISIKRRLLYQLSIRGESARSPLAQPARKAIGEGKAGQAATITHLPSGPAAPGFNASGLELEGLGQSKGPELLRPLERSFHFVYLQTSTKSLTIEKDQCSKIEAQNHRNSVLSSRHGAVVTLPILIPP